MLVFEVPRSDWEAFCPRFARQHRHESLTITKHQHVLAQQVSLLGIRFVDAGGHTLVVTVGGPAESFSSYAVLEPARIVLEQLDEPDAARLRIESYADDPLSLLFSEPVVPGVLGAA